RSGREAQGDALDLGEKGVAARVAEARRRDDAQARELAVGSLEVAGGEGVLLARACGPAVAVGGHSEGGLRRRRRGGAGGSGGGGVVLLEVLHEAALEGDLALELVVRVLEVCQIRVQPLVRLVERADVARARFDVRDERRGGGARGDEEIELA